MRSTSETSAKAGSENPNCWKEDAEISVWPTDESIPSFVERLFHPGVHCHDGSVSHCDRIASTIEHLRTRFSREEAAMWMCGYADLAEHSRDHRRLLDHLEALLRSLDCNGYENGSLRALILDWSNSHTTRFDSKLQDALQSAARRG